MKVSQKIYIILCILLISVELLKSGDNAAENGFLLYVLIFKMTKFYVAGRLMAYLRRRQSQSLLLNF